MAIKMLFAKCFGAELQSQVNLANALPAAFEP